MLFVVLFLVLNSSFCPYLWALSMEQMMELLEFFFYFEFHFEELKNIRLRIYSCLSVENLEQNECHNVKNYDLLLEILNLKFI
jgi:hypothetical protein